MLIYIFFLFDDWINLGTWQIFSLFPLLVHFSQIKKREMLRVSFSLWA